MSDIIQDVSRVVENTKAYAEEHPWQSIAAIAAWPLAPTALFAVASEVDPAILPVVHIGDRSATPATQSGPAPKDNAGDKPGSEPPHADIPGCTPSKMPPLEPSSGPPRSEIPGQTPYKIPTDRPSPGHVVVIEAPMGGGAFWTTVDDGSHKPQQDATALTAAEKLEVAKIEKLILAGDAQGLTAEIQLYHGHAHDLAGIRQQVDKDLAPQGISTDFRFGATKFGDEAVHEEGELDIYGKKGDKCISVQTDQQLKTLAVGPIDKNTNQPYQRLSVIGDADQALKAIVAGN